MKYFYGIIQCDSSVPQDITGIDDAPVRVVSRGSICAAVSDVARDDFSHDISAIARHENVLEQLMATCSLLPARFGTVLADEQVADLLAGHHDAFLADLRRVRDRMEFALKVLWPMSELRSLIEHNDPVVSAFAELEKLNGPGVRYALYKRREQAVEGILRSKAHAYVDGIQRSLLPMCSEAHCELMPASGVMLEGAYLVEKSRSADFRNLIEALQARNSRFCFVLTGPWPPYGFMSLGSSIPGLLATV